MAGSEADEDFIELDFGGTPLLATPQATTVDLLWRGDAGFTITGSFAYDSNIADGTIVSRDRLQDLQFSIYDPAGTVVASFDYDFPADATGEFRFNYDPATGTIAQSGNFDTENGFDLGVDFNTETGFDFYVYQKPEDGFPIATPLVEQVTVPGSDPDLLDVDRGGELLALDREPDLVTGLSVADLFDADFYLENNADVAAAIDDGSFNGDALTHFQQHGQFEGRSGSALFDTGYYLANNTDVAAFSAAGIIGAADHYALYGEFERRSPNANYNDLRYLAQNPDVLAALRSGNIAMGAEHYFQFGAAEGRSALSSPVGSRR